MSERKSWDVQPNPRRVQAPAPKPAPEPVRQPQPRPATRPPERRPALRPAAPRPQIQEVRSSPRRAPLPSGTLRERRKRRRRVYRYVFLALFALLVAGSFYLIWQPSFRVQSVSAQGPGADAAKQIVLSRLGGTYLYVIPRNSVFFYPQKKIRAMILDAIPEAAAVSLKRDSFSSLIVQMVPREESFIWCGTSIDTPNADGSCFDADVQGYLFKQTDSVPTNSTASSTASTTPAAAAKTAHEQVRVFGSLDKDLADGESPIRHYVAEASKMADALKFVDAMRTLGAPVSALAIRGDEADLWLNGPTKITYVLGHEQEAADVAASALPTLNLTNGSIQYVDLRFPGKAYVKKFGQ